MHSHTPQSDSTTESRILKTLKAISKEKVKKSSFHPAIKLPEKPGVRNYRKIKLIQDRLLKAATSYRSSTIDTALAKLDNEVLTRKDKNGNTFLHLAVHYNNNKMVAYILKKLGEKASILCRTQNNYGVIPLQLAHKISNIFVRTAMITLLLPKSLDYSIKPLSTHLNAKEILEQYPEAADNPVLKKNLEMAYEVINQCRDEILVSFTHPDINQMEKDQKQQVNEQVRTLRSYNLIGDTWTIEIIQRVAKKIKEHKAGNCGEYATLAIAHILEKKLAHPLTVERFGFNKGDHCFVILDCVPTRILKQFDSYGSNAVYLDAWAGEAIPIQSDKFIQKLNTYAVVSYNNSGDYYTVLPKFNPEYDTLVSQAEFHVEPVELKEEKTPIINKALTLIGTKRQRHESAKTNEIQTEKKTKKEEFTLFSKRQPASEVTSTNVSYRINT